MSESHSTEGPRQRAMSVPSLSSDHSEHALMRYFEYSQMDPPMTEVSRSFHHLALIVDRTLPGSAEKTVAIRKILEGRDAAVRAALDLPHDPHDRAEEDGSHG